MIWFMDGVLVFAHGRGARGNMDDYRGSQPQNAMGSVAANAIRGNVLGLDLYVDYTQSGDGDATIMVVNRDSFTWYESPRLQLRAETVGSGKIEVGLYGYGALATKKPKGAFRFNKA